jgi:hypothetical protein
MVVHGSGNAIIKRAVVLAAQLAGDRFEPYKSTIKFIKCHLSLHHFEVTP